MSTFSKRNGFQNTEQVPITIREEASEDFRSFLVQISYDIGLSPDPLRDIVCRILKKSPNKNNWSEFPNIHNEITDLINECDWFKVYDILEKILTVIHKNKYIYNIDEFESEINDFFVENGYGWKIVKDKIEIRGSEVFEESIKNAKNTLHQNQHSTASNELHQAITDLSRRPDPDSTGAIQHSMAALECVAREITGDSKSNLGDIMKRHCDIIPPPLDQAVTKAWGFASEYGRHIREGREPSFNEAELIVGICASVGNYLSKQKKI